MIETRTAVYNFHFHLVFVTKYRKSIFDTKEKQEELKTLLASFADKNGSTIENVEVMPDHVHLHRQVLSKVLKARLLVSGLDSIQKTRRNFTKDIFGARAFSCRPLESFRERR